MGTHRGVITYFNDSKGYGFISSEKHDSIFVHFSSITGKGYKTLREGEKVVFELNADEEGEKVARNVRKL